MWSLLCNALALVAMLVLLILAAWLVRGGGGATGAPVIGGAPPRRGPDYAASPHIVVDTLNLVHALAEADTSAADTAAVAMPPRPALTPAAIAAVIDRTAPVLRARHPGRVMYVIKDRESQFNTADAREVYRAAADRNNVYVYVVERYVDPPSGVAASAAHSARGRDDFFTALLARRWRCAVLTEDRLRDFDEFRATIQPFHVYEYAYWRRLPEREYVRPEAAAYSRMKKPRMVRTEEYFG
jgi:hypothetical protein